MFPSCLDSSDKEPWKHWEIENGEESSWPSHLNGLRPSISVPLNKYLSHPRSYDGLYLLHIHKPTNVINEALVNCSAG